MSSEATRRRGRLTRRRLLAGGLAAGTGVLIGFDLAARRPRGVEAAGTPFAPNAWLRIDPDGTVNIVNSQSEMGQGTLTTMAMIIADELEADWERVRVVQGGADLAYGNPAFGGQQLTAGSRSIRGLLTTWRRAGAAAREMLLAAAAQAWGVPVSEVRADRGAVYHDATGRRLGYGELAARAGQLPVPQQPRLKSRAEWRYIGRGVPRRDTPAKVTGTAVYGIDVSVPGMLVASVARCPVFGGRVASFDGPAARAVPGVRYVVPLASGVGVAVVADSYWAARRGRDLLAVRWDEGPNARLDSAAIRQTYRALVARPGPVARREGDAPGVLEQAGRVLEAVYEVPSSPTRPWSRRTPPPTSDPTAATSGRRPRTRRAPSRSRCA